MVAVIAFANSDVRLAIDLLEWIKLLGGMENYKCLLVADAAVDWVKSMKAMDIARSCFASARLITNEQPVQGWPHGANSLFYTASKFINEKIKEPFLWLEPDAFPLRKGWLDAIAEDYMTLPHKLFMGHIYSSEVPGLAPRIMSGVCVYPPYEVFDMNSPAGNAWDVKNAEKMVNFGKHTDLIHHFWGQRNMSPTFAEVRSHDSPVNTFTLESINPKAVIFHRNKDGSLLQVLKKKLFPQTAQPLLVVIPFCGKDVECAVRNVKWIEELGGAKQYPCLLSYDNQVRRDLVTEIHQAANNAFASVNVNAYTMPGHYGWPEGANKAFKQAAQFVQQHYKIPWLWLESDAVPLKPSWLESLSTAYYKSAKAFFGPIVQNLNHQNGVMIYPWNAAERMPLAMNCNGIAWDYISTPNMIHDRADAEPLINHCWGFAHGRPHHSEGDPIRFNSIDEVKRYIHPQAVLFHRAKFADLTNWLRLMKPL